jgi:16S rRNA (cytosine1402-N4)-methyltransferase
MLEQNGKHIVHSSPHCSVLLAEVIDHMAIKDGGRYLDCTFGAGGYSRGILQKANCFVTAVDQDPAVEKFASKLNEEFGKNFRFIQANFAEVKDNVQGEKFDGIVLDLGVSSMQLDNPERGFSFMHEGVLDMRMGKNGISAKEFVQEASEEEIANVIYKYGEEVQSRNIAKNIVKARQIEPIETTLQLAKIIREAMHYRKSKIDQATKTFQAIRIHVNKELESIEKFLQNVERLLLPNGRILIVSFHSLEDSIVKNFFKDKSMKKIARSKYTKEPAQIEEGKWLKILTKKPIVPSKEEVILNPRSRSARLRVAEKLEISYVV